jgi:cytochrome c oxidase subunit 2
MIWTLAQNAPAKLLMPEQASTNAPSQDWLFYFIWYLSVFWFVLIIALMVIFAIRYRRRNPEQQPASNVSHSTVLEIAWSVPLLGVVLFIFWLGLGGFVQISNPYANALPIQVRAYKWNWEFTYPNGYTDSELHVPVDRPVELVISSDDVIHSLFIPAFRVKKDAVPDRRNQAWFEATKPGTYPIYCTEYCGTQHSTMLSRVTVHPPGEYEVWLANASKALFEDLPDELYQQWREVDSAEQFEQFKQTVREQASEELAAQVEDLKPPFVLGEELYTRKGCQQCHSVEPGVRLSGPTWHGVWGETHAMVDGSEVRVDAEYIRESIRYPGAKIRATYQNQMPAYNEDQLSPREVDAIIAYIRTLGESQGQE